MPKLKLSTTRTILFLAVLLPAFAVCTMTARAEPREPLTLETSYIENVGKITIQLSTEVDEEGQRRVRFVHDPNQCALNEFGEPTSCTRMAPRLIETSIDWDKHSDDDRLLLYSLKDVTDFRFRLDRGAASRPGDRIGMLLRMRKAQVAASYPLFLR